MYNSSPLQTRLLGLGLDLAVLAAVTLLGALHVLPSSAIVWLIGALVGARASRFNDGPPPAGGASSSAPASAPPSHDSGALSRSSAVAAMLSALVDLAASAPPVRPRAA